MAISVTDNSTTTFTAKARDAAGNASPCSLGVVYVEDSIAPDTTVVAGPAPLVNVSSATLSFNATETASFACSLDGGAFAACTSPASYSNLPDGSHTFLVRATDAAGNADATPASRAWIVDTLPPSTDITAAPASPTSATSASFSFASEAGATFTCSLDGGAFAACTSPKVYSGLTEATHTFQVRSRDAAGNLGPVSAHSWTVDTIAPNATISSGPASPTNQTSAAIYFQTEPGATLECSLDGAGFTGCTSPASLTGVSDGSHTFRVRARDGAGNIDPTPDAHTWVVDTIALPPTIGVSPVGPANNNTPFASGASEAGGTVRVYALPGCAGSPVASGSSADYAAGLTVGVADDTTTSLSARLTDGAGNISSCGVTIDYIEDSTPPTFAGGSTALPTGNGELTISWQGATDDVTPPGALTYQICVSSVMGSCSTSFVPTTTRNGASRLARLTGLSFRTRYQMVVAALDA
ncbi:MAG: hypothetical protein ACRDKS_09380, partial [Actinomycetota bacterium]